MRGLKEGAEDICSVFADKGLEWQHTAELDALLSGELSAGEDAKTGATVGKEVSRCLWCQDTRVPDHAPRIEPHALLREIGVDPGATYATSAAHLWSRSA